MDLCLLNGHRQSFNDTHHTDGLLERCEEPDPLTVQESQTRIDCRHANHSVLRQCFAVLGDRQLPDAKQEVLSGTPPTKKYIG